MTLHHAYHLHTLSAALANARTISMDSTRVSVNNVPEKDIPGANLDTSDFRNYRKVQSKGWLDGQGLRQTWKTGGNVCVFTSIL